MKVFKITSVATVALILCVHGLRFGFALHKTRTQPQRFGILESSGSGDGEIDDTEPDDAIDKMPLLEPEISELDSSYRASNSNAENLSEAGNTFSFRYQNIEVAMNQRHHKTGHIHADDSQSQNRSSKEDMILYYIYKILQNGKEFVGNKHKYQHKMSPKNPKHAVTTTTTGSSVQKIGSTLILPLALGNIDDSQHHKASDYPKDSRVLTLLVNNNTMEELIEIDETPKDIQI